MQYAKYILHEISKRKANWIGHIFRRNCLLRQVIEGKIKGEIEVTRRRGRRRRKLLDDLKERRGYPHLKEEALDRTMWRARFGRGFRPLVGQTTKWMNAKCIYKAKPTNKYTVSCRLNWDCEGAFKQITYNDCSKNFNYTRRRKLFHICSFSWQQCTKLQQVLQIN
jgi:hypothetical protein